MVLSSFLKVATLNNMGNLVLYILFQVIGNPLESGAAPCQAAGHVVLFPQAVNGYLTGTASRLLRRYAFP